MYSIDSTLLWEWTLESYLIFQRTGLTCEQTSPVGQLPEQPVHRYCLPECHHWPTILKYWQSKVNEDTPIRGMEVTVHLTRIIPLLFSSGAFWSSSWSLRSEFPFHGVPRAFHQNPPQSREVVFHQKYIDCDWRYLQKMSLDDATTVVRVTLSFLSFLWCMTCSLSLCFVGHL